MKKKRYGLGNIAVNLIIFKFINNTKGENNLIYTDGKLVKYLDITLQDISYNKRMEYG